MKSFLFALRGGICLLILLTTVVAYGQNRPIAPGPELRSASKLSDQDKATISRYVQYYLNRFTPPDNANDRFLQIHDAKRKLTTDIFSAGVSLQFRKAYNDAVLPSLKDILDGTDVRAAVDAIRVAAELCTDQGLNVVINQLESDSRLRRIAAAGRAKISVRAKQANNNQSSIISIRTITTLARTVEKAANNETDCVALQLQLELLDSIHTASLVVNELSASKNRIQDSRLNVLGARAANLKSLDVEAIHGFLISLRSTFMADNVRTIQDGKKLAKHINTILSHCLQEWDEAQQNKETRTAYLQIIDECQQFLNLIDVKMRSSIPNRPKTDLPGAWKQKNKVKFDSDMTIWANLHKKPPYGG